MPFLRALFLVVLALLSGLLAADTGLSLAGADPAINRPYVNPDYGEWVERFERPGRELYDLRRAILAEADLRPGMVVADIGAGTGLFTRLFARAVGPSGRVLAVDVSEEFVRNIERTAAEQGLGNVVGIVNSQAGAGLSTESVDLAFIADTYHHFEQPLAMMRSIYRALRPGGRLILIDFERIPGRSAGWVMGHVRAGKEVFAEEVQQAGFVLEGEADILRRNYLLHFRKPAFRIAQGGDGTMSDERVLYDAASDAETGWRLITDTVMGGLSAGTLQRDRVDGRTCLRLRGQVRLENNGGFVQMATDLGAAGSLDASTYRGLVLDVFGNDEGYKIHLRTDATRRPWQSYRADFTASASWERIQIAFTDFQPYRLDAPLDLRELRRMGLVAIGRAFEADLCLARLALFR